MPGTTLCRQTLFFALHYSTNVLCCQVQVWDGPCVLERVGPGCGRGGGAGEMGVRNTKAKKERGECAAGDSVV